MIIKSNTIKIILDIKALFVNVVIPIVITIKFVIIILPIDYVHIIV